MIRRFPPALLALAATVLLVAGVVLVTVATGGATPQGVRTCDAALKAGAYGCVTFVSSSGDGPAAQQAWLARGGLSFALERQDGAARVTYTGGCDDAAAPVTVTRTRLRIGDAVTTRTATCAPSKGAHDAWAAQLLAGSLRTAEQSDATLVVTGGGRRIVFHEVIAPEP